MRTGRRQVIRLLLLLVPGLFSGCASLYMVAVTMPIRITPSNIYEFESSYYPETSWFYLGQRGGFHYFDRYSMGERGFNLDLHEYKLHKKYLPGITGYPYKSKDGRSESVDVEVHQNFIRIHISKELPVKIPFKSKGFITSSHRPENRGVKIEAGDQNVTEIVKKAFEE